MIRFIVKILLQFVFWKPKKWRKGLKARLESSLYSIAIRRRAKSCGRNLYILGPGVNVTSNTVVSDGVGFGKDVKIYGDGPVFIGRRAVLAEDTLVYTCTLPQLSGSMAVSIMSAPLLHTSKMLAIDRPGPEWP